MLGPQFATSGNTGSSARQTSGAGPSIHRSTDYMPLHCGVGTRSPTCISVELGTASGIGHSQWNWAQPVELGTVSGLGTASAVEFL